MRPLRFLAGVLTISLISSVVLGDLFHGQKAAKVQEPHHVAVHIDAAGITEITDGLASNADQDGCHLSTAQVAAVSLSGQRHSQMDAMIAIPKVFMDSGECLNTQLSITRGRTAPLFEHASLFAATISIRA